MLQSSLDVLEGSKGDKKPQHGTAEKTGRF